jgi:hypothetical protein
MPAFLGRPSAPISVAAMSPDRYRCAACGNLTRFDVVSERRTRAFHHFSVGGELTVEEEEVLNETVIEVKCRWCGHGNAVEVIDVAAVSGQSVETGTA